MDWRCCVGSQANREREVTTYPTNQPNQPFYMGIGGDYWNSGCWYSPDRTICSSLEMGR